MKKLLLIALVAAGCGKEPSNEVTQNPKPVLHCDYAMPEEYHLMYDTVEHKYSIMHYDCGIECFLAGRHFFLPESGYSEYSDSCEAKELLYMYLYPKLKSADKLARTKKLN